MTDDSVNHYSFIQQSQITNGNATVYQLLNPHTKKVIIIDGWSKAMSWHGQYEKRKPMPDSPKESQALTEPLYMTIQHASFCISGRNVFVKQHPAANGRIIKRYVVLC